MDYAGLRSAFQELGLANRHMIVHASLKPFGYIQNGADTVLQALADTVQSVIMPTFTYKTMITPQVGPPNNGLLYGGDEYYNREAQPFTPDMPADPLMGILPETLRNHALARRTAHPILSFAADTLFLSDLQQAEGSPSSEDLARTLETFCDGNPDLIYGNSVASGRIYEILKRLGAPILSHFHELETSIRRYAAAWIGDILDSVSPHPMCPFTTVTPPGSPVTPEASPGCPPGVQGRRPPACPAPARKPCAPP